MPDIDDALALSARRVCAVASALFGALALVCYHLAASIHVHRILIEAALTFVLFLCIGLAVAG